MPICNDITKEREIRFTCSLTKADQAEKAVRLLEDIAGIELVTQTRPNVLNIRYDIREVTLQMLEEALIDIGFKLHHSLGLRIKREVISYCEDTLRSSLGIENRQQSISFDKTTSQRENFDPRSDNWRNYV